MAVFNQRPTDISLIILDWMLPGVDGLGVIRRIRKHYDVPIMMTARDYVGDKVSGLDAGADDYITKPFETEELLARIRVILRHEGRQCLSLLKKNREIDKRLLTSFNQREYSEEVVLLVVDPAYQNLGIGRQLLASVADHWKIVPVSHYYLFADTACNYQFYKLMGLMEERKLQVKFDQQYKLTFFLYTGELNN